MLPAAHPRSPLHAPVLPSPKSTGSLFPARVKAQGRRLKGLVLGQRGGKTSPQQGRSAAGTTVQPGHPTGAPVSSVGLDTMEWCDGIGRKRRRRMADGEPQLKRNWSPGVLSSTFPGMRTGSTQSWKEAGLRLVRLTSTSHCGDTCGVAGVGSTAWLWLVL